MKCKTQQPIHKTQMGIIHWQRHNPKTSPLLLWVERMSITLFQQLRLENLTKEINRAEFERIKDGNLWENEWVVILWHHSKKANLLLGQTKMISYVNLKCCQSCVWTILKSQVLYETFQWAQFDSLFGTAHAISDDLHTKSMKIPIINYWLI